MTELQCRNCHHELRFVACDLGSTPLANSLCTTQTEALKAPRVPLCVYACEHCWLVQLPAHRSAESIFSDYVYFSSYSTAWLEHAQKFARDACKRWSLDETSMVIEAASNDGYLLQYFQHQGIPVLGIEPASNVAEIASGKGIPTENCFLGARSGVEIASRHGQADLIAANNVLAHVPDILDFTKGIAALLKPNGVVSIEFPHLLNLLRQTQFDTIYHEHYSYLSLAAVDDVLRQRGLRVFDVEELSTHGGSLRVWACHEQAPHKTTSRPAELTKQEQRHGLQQGQSYKRFAQQVATVHQELRAFVAAARKAGEQVACYGAAAKGNTLLNTAGLSYEDISYVVDANPHKQSLYMPGSGIPIKPPATLERTRPENILILPWNLRSEIADQLAYTQAWGAKLYTPIPRLQRVN